MTYLGGRALATTSRARILTFLLLTIGLSAVMQTITLTQGMTWGRAVAGMWCPGLAALLTALVCRRPLAEFGWRWGPTRYEAAGYLLPLGYVGASFALMWLTGLAGYHPRLAREITGALHLQGVPDWVPLAIGFVVTATLITAVGSFAALGEEIGWRGFLVPELSKRLGFTRTALLSGAIWVAWHLPLVVSGLRSGTPPLWYGLGCFTLNLGALSFALTWLRLKSGSLWPAVLLHAAHNAWLQQYFTACTADTGPTSYFIGEAGAALLPFTLLVAFYFWCRRKEVEAAPAPHALGGKDGTPLHRGNGEGRMPAAGPPTLPGPAAEGAPRAAGAGQPVP
jgi:membrane protease YdiL (CAAX protease family)